MQTSNIRTPEVRSVNKHTYKKDLLWASGEGRDDWQNFDRFLNFSEKGANFISQLRRLCG
jgi:hypothetical protein